MNPLSALTVRDLKDRLAELHAERQRLENMRIAIESLLDMDGDPPPEREGTPKNGVGEEAKVADPGLTYDKRRLRDPSVDVAAKALLSRSPFRRAEKDTWVGENADALTAILATYGGSTALMLASQFSINGVDIVTIKKRLGVPKGRMTKRTVKLAPVGLKPAPVKASVASPAAPHAHDFRFVEKTDVNHTKVCFGSDCRETLTEGHRWMLDGQKGPVSEVTCRLQGCGATKALKNSTNGHHNGEGHPVNKTVCHRCKGPMVEESIGEAKCVACGARRYF